MTELGNLYIIAAPSGTGKTTLVKTLVQTVDNITVSISHTTRPKRPNEVEGVNYYFIDRLEFDAMIAHHDFLEYASIFDNYYGTSKNWINKTLAKNTDIILEIDWQGHQQIKHLFPESISIFILPPSLEDLQNRLVTRNQDSPEIIKRRLADAQATTSHIQEFDYIIVNDNLNHAITDLQHIIEAGRLAKKRQLTRLSGLIKNLTGKNH